MPSMHFIRDMTCKVSGGSTLWVGGMIGDKVMLSDDTTNKKIAALIC